jgi:hypothetical protein
MAGRIKDFRQLFRDYVSAQKRGDSGAGVLGIISEELNKLNVGLEAAQRNVSVVQNITNTYLGSGLTSDFGFFDRHEGVIGNGENIRVGMALHVVAGNTPVAYAADCTSQSLWCNAVCTALSTTPGKLYFKTGGTVRVLYPSSAEELGLLYVGSGGYFTSDPTLYPRPNGFTQIMGVAITWYSGSTAVADLHFSPPSPLLSV